MSCLASARCSLDMPPSPVFSDVSERREAMAMASLVDLLSAPRHSSWPRS